MLQKLGRSMPKLLPTLSKRQSRLLRIQKKQEKITGVDPEEHHEKAEDTVEDHHDTVEDHHEDAMNEAGRGPNYKEPEAQKAADKAAEHAEKTEKAQAKKDGVVEKTE